jgi:methylmalonyl-CoA/ethylmalonyl-CoA epimerase
MEFHHIGIFTRSLDEGRKYFFDIFKIIDVFEPIDDTGICVSIQFLKDQSGILYELVAPLGSSNPVTGVLNSGKSILNHIAYHVTDLDKEILRMRNSRCIPLGSPKPAIAFQNKRVIFFLTPMNFIIELIEKS